MTELFYSYQHQYDFLLKSSKGLTTLEFMREGLGMDVRIINPHPEKKGKSIVLEMWNEQQRKMAALPGISNVRNFGYSVDQAYIDEAYLPGESRWDHEVGDPEGLSALRRMGFRPEALCCRLARVGF